MARRRALRATVDGAIDAKSVAAHARELGVMGWVRPTGEVHAEGAPDAVQALLAKLSSKLSIGRLLRLKAEAQGLLLEETPDADEVYTATWARNTAAVTQLLVH